MVRPLPSSAPAPGAGWRCLALFGRKAAPEDCGIKTGGFVATARAAVMTAAFCLALVPTSAAAAPVDASHPVTGFLRRLEEKGLIAPGFWSTLPRDDREVARALSEAATRRRGRLTPWDQRRLERYLEEFEPGRRRRNTRLHYHDSLLSLRGNVESYTFLGV